MSPKKKKKKAAEAEAAAAQAAEAAGQDAAPGAEADGVAPPEVPVEDLEHWRDKALRAQAEMANMRRRLESDTEDRTRRRLEALFHELILVSDHMELALGALPESLREADGARGFLFGLDAIRAALDGVMRGHGIEFIQPQADAEFDPELHEAVQTDHEEGLEEPRLELMRRGYRIGRNILRPAQVRLIRPAETETAPDSAG